jgi:hypothetical protein
MTEKRSDDSCWPPKRGNLSHAFAPLCADCGAVARGGILDSFTGGVATFHFLCDTCQDRFGGWSILVENSHHWKILSEKSRGVYTMRPWEPETRQEE